jgi:hypothetical protein
MLGGFTRMDLFHILVGAVMGVVGGGAVWQSARGAWGHSFLSRLLVLSIGVAFAVFGVLHFAQGIGLLWATPSLRSHLRPWFFLTCLVVWVADWFSERRSRR